MSELYITGVGQAIYVHELWECHEGPCPIHHISDHHMKNWPTCWRNDHKIMERLCPHGVGHPDPDDRNAKGINSIHGCCGDCTIKGYVKTLREITPCAHCGKGSIEYHHSEHPNRSNDRVSSLVAQSNPDRPSPVLWARIAKEIARCTSLCRSCHMIEDGRITALLKKAPYQKGKVYVAPRPCSCCKRLYKPLRKGMCTGCYNHHSGLRLRKTMSCDGCCRKPKEVSDETQ